MSTAATSHIAQRPYSSFRAKYDVSGNIITAGGGGAGVTTRSMTTFMRQRMPPSELIHSPVVARKAIFSDGNALPTTTTKRTAILGRHCGTANNKAMTDSSNTKTTAATKPWENRTFYSSTRSTGRLEKGTRPKSSLNSSPSAGSSSSTGTSIESIVPKYPPSPRAHTKWATSFLGSSQKRVYGAKENAPHQMQKKTAIGKPQLPPMLPITAAKLLTTTTTFSSKFPGGLPFEEEFYQTTRAQSVASVSSSVYSHYDDLSAAAAGPSSLPFEDEFMRKPSNEPLYVDFSKSIPSKPCTAMTNHQRVSHKNNNNISNGYNNNKIYNNSNNNNNNDHASSFFCKFESVTKGFSNSNNTNNYNRIKGTSTKRSNNCDSFSKVNSTTADHSPVVYVACASWVPKCNQQPGVRAAPKATVNDAVVVKGNTYVFDFVLLLYEFYTKITDKIKIDYLKIVAPRWAPI